MAVTCSEIGRAMQARPRGTPTEGRRGVWVDGGVVFGAIEDGAPVDGDPAFAVQCGRVAGTLKEGDEVLCLLIGGTVFIVDTIPKEVVR